MSYLIQNKYENGDYSYGHERFLCLYKDFATPLTTACALLKSCQVFRPHRRWSATSVNWDWCLLKSSFLSISSLGGIFGYEKVMNHDWEKWNTNELYLSTYLPTYMYSDLRPVIESSCLCFFLRILQLIN